MSCPQCGHAEEHAVSMSGRADGPVGCDRCAACDRRRVLLHLPTSFRRAHLLLLCETKEIADHLATDVVSLQEASGRLSALVATMGLLADGVPTYWADAGWLVRDLEDWGLLVLHHALARPLTARSRGDRPVVAGISLSQEGHTVARILG
jgi:hypothetical protein